MEEKNTTKIELHHKAVTDIMGEPPSWIVKWGATIFLLILMIPLTMSFFVDYPESINGEVEILMRGDSAYGQIKLNQFNLGKVELGQKVIIDLYSYNKSQYGSVEGKVSSIADEASPPDNHFLIEVEIEPPVNNGKNILLKKGMLGDVQIIISSRKIIYRILKSF